MITRQNEVIRLTAIIVIHKINSSDDNKEENESKGKETNGGRTATKNKRTCLFVFCNLTVCDDDSTCMCARGVVTMMNDDDGGRCG